jgi:hypothetical protein
MLAFVQALLNVALRKKGPEDLPDSRFLLWVTFLVYLLLQVPLGWIAYGPSAVLVSTIAVSIILVVSGLWVLLALFGYQARFRQSLTAMLGTNALLSALSMPFSLWRDITINFESGVALPSTIIFAIMVWSLVIDGHIFSRAISKSFGIGLMISVAFFFMHTAILFELMPDEIGS